MSLNPFASLYVVDDNMSKKNTLLTLDRELVAKAKKHKLNISQLTETAIRAKLMPYWEEKPDFAQYFDDLVEREDCFIVPLPIKSVNMVGVVPFKDFSMELDKGLNVVVGDDEAGKTTFIRAIAQTFNLTGSHVEVIPRGAEGKVRVVLDGKEIVNVHRYKEGAIIPHSTVNCILMDTPLSQLDPKHRGEFITWLSKTWGCQVVMTVLPGEFTPEMMKKWDDDRKIFDLADYASKGEKNAKAK